ncbi:MAG: geranylgeranylglyceryl/heptaprenylglyceryl phosphate synthase [Flavobacteriaceae bacterium]|nr:geranylgeranylglyceryl/heptaprenylglyceryl phosphate synthase [Flavobacteriaceae bacterium]
MKKNSILKYIQKAKKNNQKLLAILLDPDKISVETIPSVVQKINESGANLIFIGGSLLFKNILDEFVQNVKINTHLPVILFPGNAIQISDKADGILFLSLISGRNPEFLIGNQVIAAPLLKDSTLEILSTSYLLIESGRETTASYISNTKPIPRHKPEIAMATALAGEMMGHQLIYLDGGSGALHTVPAELIQLVTNHCSLPIIVGGGIKTKEQINDAYKNGATIVVIGTAFEKNNNLFNNLQL